MESESTSRLAEADLSKQYPPQKDWFLGALLLLLVSPLPAIISIIYSVGAKDIYDKVLACEDAAMREGLYAKVVRKCKIARIWVIVAIVPLAVALILVLGNLLIR